MAAALICCNTGSRVVDLVNEVDHNHGSGDDDPSVFVLDEQRFNSPMGSNDDDSPGLKQVPLLL